MPLSGTRKVARTPTNPFEADVNAEVHAPKEIIARRIQEISESIENLYGHEEPVETYEQWMKTENEKRKVWQWDSEATEDDQEIDKPKSPLGCYIGQVQERWYVEEEDQGDEKHGQRNIGPGSDRWWDGSWTLNPKP